MHKTDKYTKGCPASQIFSYKHQRCQLTCRSLGSKQQSCTSDFLPVDGCSCAEGLYLNENGICVPMAKCSCYHNDVYIKPGKSVSINDEHWWVRCFQFGDIGLWINYLWPRNYIAGFTFALHISLVSFSSVCTNGMLHCRSWRARLSSQCLGFFLICLFFWLVLYPITSMWLVQCILNKFCFSFSMRYSKSVLQLFQCGHRRAWTAVCPDLFESGQWWLCELI